MRSSREIVEGKCKSCLSCLLHIRGRYVKFKLRVYIQVQSRPRHGVNIKRKVKDDI